MATKTAGLVAEAMQKPVTAAKGLVNGAIAAFNDPPLAPDVPAAKKAKRATAKKTAGKKATAKKASAKKAAPKMDRKLVAAMEGYEVDYLARKHSVTKKLVKEIVGAVGSSRAKVEAEIKRRKAA